MNKLLLLITSLLSFAQCNTITKSNADCNSSREVRIGKVGLVLPQCYNVVFNDSSSMNQGYITSEEVAKIEFSVGGLGKSSMLENAAEDSVRLSESGNSLIKYGKHNNSVFVIVASKNIDSSSVLSTVGDVNVYFIASSIRECVLTEEEASMFAKAFKNVRVYDK